ncbi:hypothetical protein ERX37_04220 [Macrococcus hajekii]|uniref:CAP-associated domain-containing protein n=1 Tax=Macrococcus hajekii TaxID=198482 RepID=A0A4R6BNF3_9STAP|nr:CAP-associated domain-containing protein [Macrococcus hajekii]TDM03298.1 hypothetical protein ERX37_04220 [Macrococcus hajekii]GGA97699.1 hypothetical protein GCM10007190_02110 [Macrococcus hajekii]
MKNIVIKILMMLLVVIGLVLLFYSTDDFDDLEEPEEATRTEVQHVNPELTEGAGQYIGKSIDDWTADFGYPERIYAGDNKYEHYIYQANTAYYDVRVRDDKIGMIYAAGIDADISPFKVNQRAAEIYQGTFIDTEPVIKTEDGEYSFELTEVDMKTQPLIKYGKVFAQVYVDQQTDKVMGVRYMTAPLLVQMLPYTAHLNGKPLERTMNREQSILTQLNERETLAEIINMIRASSDIHQLELYQPVTKELCQRNTPGVSKSKAYDSGEAVNMWLNTERQLILNNRFSRVQAEASDCYAARYLNK